jgi:hypothetical protein
MDIGDYFEEQVSETTMTKAFRASMAFPTA